MKKIGWVATALLWVVIACEQKENGGFSINFCGDKKIKKVMDAAERGDLAIVKNYLENGGDPLLSCTRTGSSGGPFGGDVTVQYLSDKILFSKSAELLEYYLTYDLPQDLKDKMLHYYVAEEENLALTKLMVKNGAHASFITNCYVSSRTDVMIEALAKSDYDFNWADTDGNTWIITISQCPERNPKIEDELIRTIKELIAHGAKPQLENKAGKSAEDLAIDPRIKEFLRTI